MRRWNGWGEESISYPLSESATRYLTTAIGEGYTAPDASLQDVLATIPPSRLPDHPLISTDLEDRLRHARGQSLPDWVALRSGRINTFPDGIAYPRTNEQVQDLLQFGYQTDANLIPYGGGTSVVGHINPPFGGVPSLTVDLSRMQNLFHLDETSHLATFGAGIRGLDLERQLNTLGFTLGHFPQSFELSTYRRLVCRWSTRSPRWTP